MSDTENGTPRRKRLDLGGFSPAAVRSDPETKSAATRAAEEAGFTTRHSKPETLPTPPTVPEVIRRGRKRSTGRNTQFTVKLKAETNNAIYELADRLDVSALAEVIELAVDALRDKLANERKV